MLRMNMEGNGLEKNPNLDLVHVNHLLTIPQYQHDRKLIVKLMDAILKDDMAPFYQSVCRDLEWTIDEEIYNHMKAKNDEVMMELNDRIENAKYNLGDREVRESYLRKAEHYSRIGDREKALSLFDEIYDVTFSINQRLDIIFHKIRIGLFIMDNLLLFNNIENARRLVEEGADWDHRNRFKVYEGLYCLAKREFRTACTLFLESVSTYNAYELMDYHTFIKYTVYVATISLSRNQLREKIMKGPKILEALESLPDVRNYVFALYNCRYSDFLYYLADVEEDMKKDYYMHPFNTYYVREMKALAFAQLVESYRALTLVYMAEYFGVSVECIDEWQLRLSE